MRKELFIALLFVSLGYMKPAFSYPPLEEFSAKHSGRPVNCAMCHINDEGPMGNGPGQIGSLTADEMELQRKARAQKEPGGTVDSPVLNEFGNHVLHKLGITKLLEVTDSPQRLPAELGQSDLDGDGILDGEEYLDGTDPRNKLSGAPEKLFAVNLDRYKIPIIFALVAVLLIQWGLSSLLSQSKVSSSLAEE